MPSKELTGNWTTLKNEACHLELLMAARTRRPMNKNTATFSEANANPPKLKRNVERQEEDLFSDPSPLDPIDANQHNEILSSAAALLKEGKNGLSHKEHKHLETVMSNHLETFRCS